MPGGPIHQLLRCLRRAAAGVETSAATDAQLLERFAVGGDPDAFELLTWRHGRAVWGVCRRLLRDEHQAEDAFQATFLTLARKTRSIVRGESVGGWLYRVAYHVALRAKGQAAQTAAREQAGQAFPRSSSGGPTPAPRRPGRN
jgi:DNA-directed RNA polymerase specialized sigma24 family protein